MYKSLISVLVILSCEIISLNASNHTITLTKGDSIIINGFVYRPYRPNMGDNNEVIMVNGSRYEFSDENDEMEWEEIKHFDENQSVGRVVDSTPTFSTLLPSVM